MYITVQEEDNPDRGYGHRKHQCDLDTVCLVVGKILPSSIPAPELDEQLKSVGYGNYSGSKHYILQPAMKVLNNLEKHFGYQVVSFCYNPSGYKAWVMRNDIID